MFRQVNYIFKKVFQYFYLCDAVRGSLYLYEVFSAVYLMPQLAVVSLQTTRIINTFLYILYMHLFHFKIITYSIKLFLILCGFSSFVKKIIINIFNVSAKVFIIH